MDHTNAQNRAIHAKSQTKKFGHELGKRPEVFREHVLAGLRLGTLKHPYVKIKGDTERNKHDMQGSWNRISKSVQDMKK